MARSSRLTMGLVLTATAFGVLVTSACTNVAGLTGYEFGDASGDGEADGRAPAGDSATDASVADGGRCKASFGGAGGSDACSSCAEQNCCAQTVSCGLTANCLQRARKGNCTVADVECLKMVACLGANRCACS